MAKPLSAVAAYDRVLAELKAAENRAIDSGKPTMWAYLANLTDALERARHGPGAVTYVDEHGVDYDHGDENPKIIRAMERVLDDYFAMETSKNGACNAHDRVIRSEAAALQVYATRVLRLAGKRVPIRSLDWLRSKKRWLDAI